ncbi:ABC transporter ATP-binding protein [Magnetospirillum sp. SS-4]|uniref:ABC transporter ATP-binding protein n=1 Tax=Magnetospirillum sp. SS-4 TaxID=2681465 RepID=UPI001380E3A7|nr:ABC transporter ATP-binding protein [Magnetospirillum sp. SS-4]CAA7626138.1 leucine/isoleucine/valine transporter subunit; ATP-binding component of ABC superfamily [Magnetospirillum sp. SS-4]
MLEIRGLDLFYGDAQALAGVSLSVAEHEVVAIVGANGAGKTSLIRAIAGMEKVAAGSIVFEGKPITGLASSRICDMGIAQVAEGRQIFPTLSVLENLEMGAVIPRARDKRKDTLERCFHLFPKLRSRIDQAAGTLSGGEQQMLAIGRCLMGQPRLMMFDEPSLGLAPAVVSEMFKIIRDLHAEGMTVILVEQNVQTSLKLADRGYVLENGGVVLSGTGTELLNDPGVRQAYLGL